VGVSESSCSGASPSSGATSAGQPRGRARERRAAKTKPPLFGADLVARKLLNEAQLRRAMARQTSELAYETLRWTHGFFQLKRATDADDTAALVTLARGAASASTSTGSSSRATGASTSGASSERVVDSFDRVFVRDENKITGMPRGTFTRRELAVLERVDGRLTVRRDRARPAHGLLRRLADPLPASPDEAHPPPPGTGRR